MYGWNERPTKATVKHYIGGEAPAAVYKIGEYLVTVPGISASEEDAPSVTYQSEYRHTSDPRVTLPNMEVRDGQIRIELTDLVGLVLSRLEPVDLAQTLWQDESVRSQFMDCLITRYNSDSIDDKERRQFVDGVKDAVHDAALDKLAGTMAKLEYETSRIAHHYDEVRRINEVLREQNVMVDHHVWNDVEKRYDVKSAILEFDERQHGRDDTGNHVRGELSIGGRAWEDARTFWRDEIRKQFPIPQPESVAA